MVAEGLGITVLPDYSVIGDPLEQHGVITWRPLADDRHRGPAGHPADQVRLAPGGRPRPAPHLRRARPGLLDRARPTPAALRARLNDHGMVKIEPLPDAARKRSRLPLRSSNRALQRLSIRRNAHHSWTKSGCHRRGVGDRQIDRACPCRRRRSAFPDRSGRGRVEPRQGRGGCPWRRRLHARLQPRNSGGGLRGDRAGACDLGRDHPYSRQLCRDRRVRPAPPHFAGGMASGPGGKSARPDPDRSPIAPDPRSRGRGAHPQCLQPGGTGPDAKASGVSGEQIRLVDSRSHYGRIIIVPISASRRSAPGSCEPRWWPT